MLIKIQYTFGLDDDVVMFTVLTLKYSLLSIHYDDEKEHNDSDNKHDAPSIVYLMLQKVSILYFYDEHS